MNTDVCSFVHDRRGCILLKGHPGGHVYDNRFAPPPLTAFEEQVIERLDLIVAHLRELKRGAQGELLVSRVAVDPESAAERALRAYDGDPFHVDPEKEF